MSSKIYELVRKHTDLGERVNAILEVVDPTEAPGVMAYLLKQTLEVLRGDPCLHYCLVTRLPADVICRFIPGLLSAYFRVLRDHKTRDAVKNTVVKTLECVLSLDIVLDEVSETNIHDFFYFNRESMFEEIYVICSQRFRSSKRIFFVIELLLLGRELDENDYVLINENIEEVFTPELIGRLLDLERYKNNENVFGRLVRMYNKGKDVGGIIARIQCRYAVKDCVVELCPVNEATTRSILLTNDLKKIDLFIRNANHVPLRQEIVKRYLELSTSPEEILDSEFGRRFNISRMISEDYDELLEYAFSRMQMDIGALINLVRIEFRPRVDDFIFRSIDFVHGCCNAEELGKHLCFLKIAVWSKCLRRSVLRRIFDGLVYLDHDDYRIRCAKYEIFSELLEQYALMDRVIENELYVKDGDSECHIRDVMLRERQQILKRIDTKDIDEDNVKVLVAVLWEEISITPLENELMAISLLLKKIVDLTGSFYEARMTRSNFISHLIEQHGISEFNETKRRRTNEFFSLLESIILNYKLSKNMFGSILFILMDYFHIFNLESMLQMMVKKDKHHCLYILYRHNHSGRRISSDLRAFLKKSLLEAS